MPPVRLFVSGIGTGVGKTFISAAMVSALAADYWKPIQTGYPVESDSETVRKLCPNAGYIHRESFALRDPLSPHAAAENEGKAIDLASIEMPKSDNHLIVEGSGGLLVPLNYDQVLADLIHKLNLPVVVVARLYLGSINHTMLTIEALRSRRLTIFGVVFVGPETRQSQDAIERLSGIGHMIRIPEYTSVTSKSVEQASHLLRDWISNGR